MKILMLFLMPLWALVGQAGQSKEIQVHNDLGRIRSRAHRVLAKHCGYCHTPGISTTETKALQVFDLGRDDWFLRVTDKNLKAMLGRLEARSIMTPLEISYLVPRGIDPPPAPTKLEVQALSDLVNQKFFNMLGQGAK